MSDVDDTSDESEEIYDEESDSEESSVFPLGKSQSVLLQELDNTPIINTKKHEISEDAEEDDEEDILSDRRQETGSNSADVEEHSQEEVSDTQPVIQQPEIRKQSQPEEPAQPKVAAATETADKTRKQSLPEAQTQRMEAKATLSAPTSGGLNALRMRLRENNKSNANFVSINLDSMSGIAVADIKRFSLSSTAIVDVEVAKAKNLHPVKSGPPSPMCLLAIRKDTTKDHEKKIDIKKAHEQTSVMPKNSNPTWNEKKELKLDQVKGDSQRWLIVEIHDKSPKGDFLGFVELNLNNIADLVQREEWFELKRRKKKEKVSGEILLRTRIRPERKVEEAIVIRGESFPAIPSFIYNSFWNQHCVRQVSITQCEITTIPDGFFALGSLEVLLLHHNNITTVPKTLGRMFNLKVLDLSYNRISTLPAELSNLKNLHDFNITENKWTDEVPPPVFDLDLWCEIRGKPASWDPIIEEELRKRETAVETCSGDEALMNEKEKEIQRLLSGMK